MKKKYKNLFNLRLMRGIISLAIKGYLFEKGWNRSYIKRQSITNEGQVIPWLTYSFLDFIEKRLSNELIFFEFGSGNSTLYFSKHVKNIYSIEHDKFWFETIKSDIPKNVTLNYVSIENGEYEATPLRQNVHYDIILIDGRNRVSCIKNAVQRLTKSGVIIFDDSERAKYAEIFPLMESLGFKHIPFTGIAIGAIHGKTTSLFYRSNNCLGV
ncbi:FkbM family methyltransferase [Sphingobacterium olei]|uniref:FkbM family methyltransferase n=1 Tax=Sphingobacterium olei TaxID=2571155 RepID=A0A4U0P3X9_9SPHI|nr:FkbM family methyltransferase [Sphingobacterium olei]TJZ62076.1 FkbM family methyltransferase [Sphingobacterium olei]